MTETLHTDDIEPIAAQDARAAIEQAIIERLGENWQEGWLLVHDNGFLVRLNKDEINLDFLADLLGNVEVTEKQANPLQLSGKFLAWMILGTSIFIAIAIAAILGII
jgi:hypothetical protein